MENASKALIMAGEILIALIVIGLAVIIISRTGKFSANINDRIAADKVAEFNQNFTKYEGRINITAEEIATIINFAKHSNDEKELSIEDKGTVNQSVYWVDVEVVGYDIFTTQDNNPNGMTKAIYNDINKFKQWINQFIYANNGKYFYCNVDYSTREIRPKVERLPNGNQKGIIHINLANDDITYSTNTKDRTLLATKIAFGITKIDDTNWPVGTTAEQKQEYAFNARNDANKMYIFTYN